MKPDWKDAPEIHRFSGIYFWSFRFWKYFFPKLEYKSKLVTVYSWMFWYFLFEINHNISGTTSAGRK